MSIFLSYYHQNASRFPKTMDNYHKGHLSKKFNLFSLTTPPMCYIFVGLASAPIRTLCPVDVVILCNSKSTHTYIIHIYMPYSKIIFFQRTCLLRRTGWLIIYVLVLFRLFSLSFISAQFWLYIPVLFCNCFLWFQQLNIISIRLISHIIVTRRTISFSTSYNAIDFWPWFLCGK